MATLLEGRIASSRIVTVPGSGHLVPLERPEDVARLAVGFLAGLPRE